MERSVLCQAFVLGCGFFLLSDAAISLNFIENSGTNLECGTSVVLMCEIQPYGNSLTWKVDGVIAAQCGSTSASCISNPAFSRYTFSYDISSGTFNLTIATVGLSDDGIDFTCEDGTNFVTKSASTIVPFDANSCSVTPTVGSSSVTVEATTSCVYPASEVEIQWYYFESIGGPENEMTESDFSYTSSKNEDNSSCTSGACTSGNGVTTVVENAVFDIQSTGTEVYIQARFVQFSKSELKNTTKKYKIKKGSTTTSSTTTSKSSTTTTPTVNASRTSAATNPSTTSSNNTCVGTCIIIPACVVPFVTLLVFFFVCYLLRRRRNNKKKKDNCKVNNSNHSYGNDVNLSEIVLTPDTSGRNSGYGENN